MPTVDAEANKWPGCLFGHTAAADTHSATSTAEKRCLQINGENDEKSSLSAEEYRAQHELSVKLMHSEKSVSKSDGKSNKPKFQLLDPVQGFDRAPFNPEILKVIKTEKFLKPSPVQAQCWPYLMAGFDIVAVARTGSGKTCG
jgi:ATP-dependent RNA helicase DDX5/DBP2